jgi:hypothetical protein
MISAKKRGKHMDIDPKELKHQKCPYDEDQAILLVDVETESAPATDEDGNLQYYCRAGKHVFSIDEDGKAR